MGSVCMTPCPRKGKWIGGCRFEARYDYEPLPGPTTIGDAIINVICTKEDHRMKATYVESVCTRCGEIKKREQP